MKQDCMDTRFALSPNNRGNSCMTFVKLIGSAATATYYAATAAAISFFDFREALVAGAVAAAAAAFTASYFYFVAWFSMIFARKFSQSFLFRSRIFT